MEVITVRVGKIGYTADRGTLWVKERDAMGEYYSRYAELRITYHVLSDNLCCMIASQDRILVLLVMCGLERHALRLNQSIPVPLPPKDLCRG